MFCRVLLEVMDFKGLIKGNKAASCRNSHLYWRSINQNVQQPFRPSIKFYFIEIVAKFLCISSKNTLSNYGLLEIALSKTLAFITRPEFISITIPIFIFNYFIHQI